MCVCVCVSGALCYMVHMYPSIHDLRDSHTCLDGEMEKHTFGVPFDLENIPLYHMRPQFDPAFERVMSAIYLSRQGTINVCPLVPIIARIMLHIIDEWEVFAVLSHVMSRTAWMDQGQVQLSASISTLHTLIQTHIVSHGPIV